jgi:hypothetical protein
LEWDLEFAVLSGVATSGTPSFHVRYQGVARHDQYVAFPTLPRCSAKRGNPAEFAVADNPAVRQTGQVAAEKVQRDLPLVLESVPFLGNSPESTITTPSNPARS